MVPAVFIANNAFYFGFHGAGCAQTFAVAVRELTTMNFSDVVRSMNSLPE